jgi:hypothetical protein
MEILRDFISQLSIVAKATSMVVEEEFQNVLTKLVSTVDFLKSVETSQDNIEAEYRNRDSDSFDRAVLEMKQALDKRRVAENKDASTFRDVEDLVLDVCQLEVHDRLITSNSCTVGHLVNYNLLYLEDCIASDRQDIADTFRHRINMLLAIGLSKYTKYEFAGIKLNIVQDDVCKSGFVIGCLTSNLRTLWSIYYNYDFTVEVEIDDAFFYENPDTPIVSKQLYKDGKRAEEEKVSAELEDRLETQIAIQRDLLFDLLNVKVALR